MRVWEAVQVREQLERRAGEEHGVRIAVQIIRDLAADAFHSAQDELARRLRDLAKIVSKAEVDTMKPVSADVDEAFNLLAELDELYDHDGTGHAGDD